MTKTIRCKLICQGIGEVTGTEDNRLRAVQFSGITEQEDAIFGKYTPSANFYASIQPEVAEQLEVGAAYYFDIHKA